MPKFGKLSPNNRRKNPCKPCTTIIIEDLNGKKRKVKINENELKALKMGKTSHSLHLQAISVSGPVKAVVDKDSLDVLTLRKFTARIKRENEERKQKGVPTAKYDIASGKAYLEYADGSRVYANKA